MLVLKPKAFYLTPELLSLYNYRPSLFVDKHSYVLFRCPHASTRVANKVVMNLRSLKLATGQLFLHFLIMSLK